MYYFLFLRRKPKTNCANKRKFWVRPIFTKRKRFGEYNQLFMELRLADREYFFKYFTFSTSSTNDSFWFNKRGSFLDFF